MWFTPMGGACIGVVLVETEYDGIHFYIGLGIGVNEEKDAERIAQTGARFPWAAGVEMFGVPTEPNNVRKPHEKT
jgi:hypothetical protein